MTGIVLLAFAAAAKSEETPDDANIKKYTQALAANPKDVTAYHQRGAAYFNIRAYDKALADYTEAIKLNDHNEHLYCGRGDSHRVLGEYDLAVADYTAAIKLNNRHAHCLGMRGECYRTLGKFEEAIADLERSLDAGYPRPDYKSIIAEMREELKTKKPAAAKESGSAVATNSTAAVFNSTAAVLATKGVVLFPSDLSLSDWPERCAKAGINTIALHAQHRLGVIEDFLDSDAGRSFLARCKALGIGVEYELHAMGELLSREYFLQNPALFRMNDQGNRTPDANCCPHSAAALDIIARRAVKWAKILKPTTSRYYYWPDDGAQWCRCPECKGFTASEQALLVENHILRALRKEIDPQATLSHISYAHTLAAPVQVKPEAGIFLEFAPIARNYTNSITNRAAITRHIGGGKKLEPDTNGGYLDILAANMKVFGADTAQVLEYWLDASMASGWRHPVVKLPFDAAVCRADIDAYRRLGVRHITTFAAFIDAEYVKLHGDPQQEIIAVYGEALNSK